MTEHELFAKVGARGADPEAIAAEVARKPRLLDALFAGIQSDKPPIRYGSSKVLRLVSEQAPDLVYPCIATVIELLDSPNKFLQWDAGRVIANLAPVDADTIIDKLFDRYFAPISGPVMITAANLIGSAPKIARAKPHLANRIAAEILKVSKARYATTECRNVAAGHAISAFAEFLDLIEDKKAVFAFVRKQLKNSRPSTRKKAEAFLKRFVPKIAAMA